MPVPDDRAARKKPTRNGESIDQYEKLLETGQSMNEGANKMYGKEPRAE